MEANRVHRTNYQVLQERESSKEQFHINKIHHQKKKKRNFSCSINFLSKKLSQGRKKKIKRDHLDTKKYKHCLGSITNKTFRIPELFIYKTSVLFFFPFLTYFSYFLPLLFDPYICSCDTISFIPHCIYSEQDAYSRHGQNSYILPLEPPFVIEQDSDKYINWCNKNPYRFLGALLIDSSTHFNHSNTNFVCSQMSLA